MHDARGKKLGEILSLRAGHSGKKLPPLHERQSNADDLACRLAALAVHTLDRDAKDGDILLMKVRERIMQGDAQKVGGTRHIRIEQRRRDPISLVEYLPQVVIGAAFDTATG
jgi:hypothetical protein